MKKQLLTIIALMLLATPVLAQEPLLPDLKKAARKAPKDEAAQLAYGNALIKANRLREAEAQMNKLVRLADGSIESLYQVARVKFAQGHYKKARAHCRSLEQKDSSHVLSHVCMARSFLVWRRASRAFDHIDKALVRDPNHYETLLVLADGRRIQGDFKASKEAYRKALTLRANSADAYLGLGRLHLVLGTRENAVQALRQAHKRDGDNPDIQFELGQLLSGKEAVGLLVKAVAGRKKWRAARIALARARLNAGEHAAAEGDFRAVIKKDKNNPLAHSGLGEVLLRKRQYEEAETTLKRALELQPGDQGASMALAELYELTERHEEAFTQYRSAASLKQQDAGPFIAAAELGMRLSRPLLAAAFLERALDRKPESARALGLYGDVLAARGDRSAAKDYYHRALQGKGEFDRAGIQARLNKLQ